MTQAEAQLVKQERKRLQLDNHDWSSEPFVADRDLYEMSPHMVERFRMSNVWVYDIKAMGYRNIDHADNSTWFIEYLMARVSDGSILPEDMHAELAKMPVYGKSK